MPRFLVIEQGPPATAARMVVDAPSQADAMQRATAAGWKVASVTVEGDLEGPASVEQLRARLAILEQKLDALAQAPGVRLSFWKVFWAVIAAVAVGVLVMLFIPR